MRKRSIGGAWPILVLAAIWGTSAFAQERTAAETSDTATLDTDPHLVGWWKMDETSGKTAPDSSRYRRNGTLKGNVSFDTASVAGRIGKALRLGGGDWIEIAGYKGIVGTRPRTLAAWIKTAAPTGQIMSWGTDEPGKMWTFLIMGTGIYIDPRGGYLYTDSKVHDDVWHHVAATVDEAESPNLENNARLYKDGALQRIHDIGLLNLYPIDTGDKLDVRIGRGIKGALDDVRLYDRALSAKEIQGLFKAAGAAPK